MGYTREFLINAFLWRYTDTLLTLSKDHLDRYVKMVTDFYDKVGKDQFRVYGSLDADKIKEFRLATGC